MYDGPERRHSMDEQIAGLDKKLDLFMLSNKAEHTEIMNTLTRMDACLTKHNDTLYGNGHIGLTTRVDRQENWSMFWRTVVCGLLVVVLYGLIAVGELNNQVKVNTQRWDKLITTHREVQ